MVFHKKNDLKKLKEELFVPLFGSEVSKKIIDKDINRVKKKLGYTDKEFNALINSKEFTAIVGPLVNMCKNAAKNDVIKKYYDLTNIEDLDDIKKKLEEIKKLDMNHINKHVDIIKKIENPDIKLGLEKVTADTIKDHVKNSKEISNDDKKKIIREINSDLDTKTSEITKKMARKKIQKGGYGIIPSAIIATYKFMKIVVKWFLDNYVDKNKSEIIYSVLVPISNGIDTVFPGLYGILKSVGMVMKSGAVSINGQLVNIAGYIPLPEFISSIFTWIYTWGIEPFVASFTYANSVGNLSILIINEFIQLAIYSWNNLSYIAIIFLVLRIFDHLTGLKLLALLKTTLKYGCKLVLNLVRLTRYLLRNIPEIVWVITINIPAIAAVSCCKILAIFVALISLITVPLYSIYSMFAIMKDWNDTFSSGEFIQKRSLDHKYNNVEQYII